MPFLVLALLAASPVWAGSITQPAAPDPLLDSGPTAPCADGVDYAAGSDANGAAVVPADVGARSIPVPDAIAIPLRQAPHPQPGPRPGHGRASAPGQVVEGDSAYISIDGRKLAPLINPAPCGSPRR